MTASEGSGARGASCFTFVKCKHHDLDDWHWNIVGIVKAHTCLFLYSVILTSRMST